MCILSMVSSHSFEPVVRRQHASPFVAEEEGVEFALQTNSTYHAISAMYKLLHTSTSHQSRKLPDGNPQMGFHTRS